MLKFTSIVGYTSCGPTYIESFLTIFGQCINVLNYKYIYIRNMHEKAKWYTHTDLTQTYYLHVCNNIYNSV